MISFHIKNIFKVDKIKSNLVWWDQLDDILTHWVIQV
jgi:hypothetical protein